jgi:RNA polymerase sigma-70 factor (ECF subfamily)
MQCYTSKKILKHVSFCIFSLMPIQENLQDFDGLKRMDPLVIGSIYDEFFPVVFRYIRYRVGDETQAEDISSDVFTRLLVAVNNGKGPETNIKAWLLATASNAVNDHHRRSYRHPVEDLSEHMPDLQTSTLDTAEKLESGQVVRQALSRLTPEQQHVIALRFGQELSLEEAAEMMKKNVNAVKQLQFRALVSLRRLIDEKR